VQLDTFIYHNLSYFVFSHPLCLCALVRVYFFSERLAHPRRGWKPEFKQERTRRWMERLFRRFVELVMDLRRPIGLDYLPILENSDWAQCILFVVGDRGLEEQSDGTVLFES